MSDDRIVEGIKRIGLVLRKYMAVKQNVKIKHKKMVVYYHHFFMGDWDEIYLSYGGYMYILLAD